MLVNRYGKNTAYSDLEPFGNLFVTAIIKVALDPLITILYANDVFYEKLGCSKKSFQERYKNSLKEIMIEEDIAVFYQKMMFPNKKGEVTSYIHIQQNYDTKYNFMIQGKVSEECYKEQYKIINCIMVDITEFVLIQERLELEEERYRIISDISNDINFEYDFEKDTVYFSEKFTEVFHRNHIIEAFRTNKAVKDAIHGGDLDEYHSIFRYHISDEKSKYKELRIKVDNQDYAWFGIQYTSIFNKYGQSIKLFGRIMNIDKEKKEMEQLIKKSQIDTMTKLLNKKTTELKVEQYLRKMPFNKLGALIIIDVDDFKNVNDSSGHLMGDKVLMEIANIIRHTFRSSDIMGRIGGDEFLVFMKDVTNEDQIKEKLKHLCDEIHLCSLNEKNNVEDNLLVVCEKDWNGSISVSIGVAVQRLRKYSFQDLFHQADQALYCSKEKGKNQYTIFY